MAARSDMLYGSLLAGMALSNARLGGVHVLAHPLGMRFHIPHGTVCGLLLPHVVAHNLPWARTSMPR
jgi:alcohol dehydrogenase